MQIWWYDSMLQIYDMCVAVLACLCWFVPLVAKSRYTEPSKKGGHRFCGKTCDGKTWQRTLPIVTMISLFGYFLVASFFCICLSPKKAFVFTFAVAAWCLTSRVQPQTLSSGLVSSISVQWPKKAWISSSVASDASDFLRHHTWYLWWRVSGGSRYFFRVVKQLKLAWSVGGFNTDQGDYGTNWNYEMWVHAILTFW
jgi:hypothetical protein